MTIQLKKFGTMLVFRQAGKEALAAFSPSLKNLPSDELVFIDFDGVLTLSPSWGDEFLSSLHERFGEHLTLKESANPSIKATIEILEESRGIRFKREE